MNVILIRDEFCHLTFRNPESERICRKSEAVLGIVLNCDLSTKGTGVNSKNEFPWTTSPALLNLDERNDGQLTSFFLEVTYTLHMVDNSPRFMGLKVEGPFQKIMEFVFTNVPDRCKLKFGAELLGLSTNACHTESLDISGNTN